MNPDRKIFRKKDKACRLAGNAAAYLTGDLNDEERQAFERHLAACPDCARELESARRIIGVMKTLEPAGVPHDLTPAILARVDPRYPGRQTPTFRHIHAIAAALSLLLGGAIGFQALHKQHAVSRLSRPVTGLNQQMASACGGAVAWLCRTQEPDGSWNAAAWGGDKQFGLALSSLAVMAILGSEPVSEERAATVRKAVGYLVKQQDTTGTFGPLFSSAPYNQGITTLALLRAFNEFHDEGLRQPIDKAVAAICRNQAPEGGWGYCGETAQQPNLSVTLWQTEALKLAVRLGWNKARPNVQRAVHWVASIADDRGSFGYQRANDIPSETQTLTAMGAMAILNAHDNTISPDHRKLIFDELWKSAMSSNKTSDYYRTYFLTATMKDLPDTTNVNQLAIIRRSIVHGQIALGSEKGSWPPNDRWGSIGGRVYATAMASLSLE